MKEGKLIVYESCKLKYYEKRYFSYKLEFTVVFHTLQIWRHYLLGKRFLLITSHSSLTNLVKKPNLNAR